MAKRAPKPPAWLKDPKALERWSHVLSKLGPDVDVESLATYCAVWARWRKAEEEIGRVGNLIKRGDRVVANPLLAIAKDAGAQVRELEQRLRLGEVAPADEPLDNSPAGGPLLTRRELSKVMNVVMMTITKWERDGMPIAWRGRKGKPSLYRELEVRQWMAARESRASNEGAVDLVRERARKERAQAILAEQTFQSRSRELLPRAEVEKAWAAEIAAVRTKLLAIPTALADQIQRAALVDGVDAVEELLQNAIYDVLRELAGAIQGGNGNGDHPPASKDESIQPIARGA